MDDQRQQHITKVKICVTEPRDPSFPDSPPYILRTDRLELSIP